jgi:PAS domain S-box-containing protein
MSGIDRQTGDEQATRLLAAIVESSEDAIIGKTLDDRVTSWNKAAERIFGFTAEEMLGQPISLLTPRGAPTRYGASSTA